MNKMYLVVPCYNEAQIINKTARVLKDLIEALKNEKMIENGKILFVNDKSTDKTKEILQKLSSKNCEFISMKKNSGQQKAILAGLKYVYKKCDFAITLDCDLQDDTEKIKEMIYLYLKGNEIVYGVRNDRKSDTKIKRITAELYYFILRLIDKSTVKNHGDFRLMSSNAMKKTIENSTQFPYLRGIAPKLKLKSDYVYYTRKMRMQGKSKYNIRKMLYLAFCGFYTAFSKIKY